jgi:hypothetical protein
MRYWAAHNIRSVPCLLITGKPRSKAWLSSSAQTLGACVSVTLDAQVFPHVYSVLSCMEVEAFAIGWSPVQGVQPIVYRIKKLRKRPRPNRRAVESLTINIILKRIGVPYLFEYEEHLAFFVIVLNLYLAHACTCQLHVGLMNRETWTGWQVNCCNQKQSRLMNLPNAVK